MTTQERIELIEAMWKFSERISTSKFIPQYMRGDVATTFHAVATGQDLGLSWTHAPRSIFPSPEGGMGMKGDVILALLLAHNFKVDFAFTEEPIGCTCTITRPEGGAPVSRTFTMDDARKIQTRWRPDDSEQGGHWEMLADNWYYRNFPASMTQWRSLAHCARVAAADLTGGIYLPEELQAVEEPKGSTATAEGPGVTFVVAEKEEPAEQKAEPEPETAAPAEEKPAEPETKAAEPETKPAESETAPAETEVVKEPSFDDLISMVAATIGGEVKPAHKLIARYFLGFLDVKSVPKDRAKLFPPLVKLAAVIKDKVGDLKADPEALGALLSGRAKSPLDQEFERLQWPPDLQALARQAMKLAGQDEAQFIAWLQYPAVGEICLANMEVPALQIFLPMFLLSRGRAWEAIDFAVARNASVTFILQEIVRAAGKPVEEWDRPFCDKLMDGLRQVAAPEKSAAPPPPEDDAENWADGGLPFDK